MKSSVMCPGSQSLIASLRAAVTTWRQRKNWSRETVIAEIVGVHKRIGAEAASGIQFEEGGDAFNRMRANAERVWRWLDDETKDTNLLPANFIRSLIVALPLDLRLQVMDALLMGTGLHADVLSEAQSDASLPQHLRRISKECGEAAASIAQVLDKGDATDLANADRELAEAAEAIESARNEIGRRRTVAAASASAA